jgi:hypothetical protein
MQKRKLGKSNLEASAIGLKPEAKFRLTLFFIVL